MNAKRLRYADLIADNGLDSGARTGWMATFTEEVNA